MCLRLVVRQSESEKVNERGEGELEDRSGLDAGVHCELGRARG